MGFAIDAPAEIPDRIPHLEGVGSSGQNAVLRAFQFRRRDHFHRFRDFLGFFNGVDLPPDGLKAGHVVYTWCLFIKAKPLSRLTVKLEAEATISSRDASSLADSVIRIRCLQKREPSLDRCVGIIDNSIAPPTLDKEFAVTGRARIGAGEFTVAKPGSAGYLRHIVKCFLRYRSRRFFRRRLSGGRCDVLGLLL